MPFALAFLGILLIVSAARGTIQPLGQQLVLDFSGQGNFFYWIFAIIILGAIGYIRPLRPVSLAMLGLLLVVMFLANGVGFWPQLTSAIAGVTGAAAVPGSTTVPAGVVPAAPTAGVPPSTLPGIGSIPGAPQ